LGIGRIVAVKPGSMFELGDEGIERAVLVVRRAEITEPGMRLAFDVRGKCRCQPRLADARLTGNQHYPSFAAFCLLPAASHQLDCLVAPDERRLLRAQGLEPAHLAAFAQHPPGALRLGKAGKLLRPEVFQIKQLADLPAGSLRRSPACSARPGPA